MVSVCIATYNGEKYIKTQLESILSQLDKNDAVVISDDMSNDRTIEIINQIDDERVKLFTRRRFGSPIKNFENAITNSTGDIIFLADQDDFWLPGKVNTMCKALKNYDLVISNCYIGDKDLNIIKDSYFEWRKSKTGLFKNLWRNSYLGCCIAFNRKMLERLLPFPNNVPMHDMWIGIIAEFYYNPVFIEDRLMVYRRHDSNVTKLTKDFKSEESYWKRFKYRINLLAALISKV